MSIEGVTSGDRRQKYVPVDPSGQTSVISIIWMISTPTQVSQGLGGIAVAPLGDDGPAFRPVVNLEVVAVALVLLELCIGMGGPREYV